MSFPFQALYGELFELACLSSVYCAKNEHRRVWTNMALSTSRFYLKYHVSIDGTYYGPVKVRAEHFIIPMLSHFTVEDQVNAQNKSKIHPWGTLIRCHLSRPGVRFLKAPKCFRPSSA